MGREGVSDEMRGVTNGKVLDFGSTSSALRRLPVDKLLGRSLT